jgi:hypothetical protein
MKSPLFDFAEGQAPRTASVDITTAGGDCGEFPGITRLQGDFVPLDAIFGRSDLGTSRFTGPTTPSTGFARGT